jgi:hypothetical protein
MGGSQEERHKVQGRQRSETVLLRRAPTIPPIAAPFLLPPRARKAKSRPPNGTDAVVALAGRETSFPTSRPFRYEDRVLRSS